VVLPVRAASLVIRALLVLLQPDHLRRLAVKGAALLSLPVAMVPVEILTVMQ
jgi:hypothetical protein